MDDASTPQATNEEHRSPAGQPLVPRRIAPRAANAASHGLTAKRYLPEILGPELLDRHRQRFLAEWRPATATQAYLVEELARHAAALERATPIEEAVLRTSALGLSGITDTDGNEDVGQDHVLAGACGTETVDRVTRYRRAHEKGFLSALARLRELRVVSDIVLVPAASCPLRFNEIVCLRYLKEHHQSRSRCPSCGGAEGTWVVGRELWQCRQCRRQVSVRNRTVMARSQLPLRTWFAAIAAILQDQNISTEALSDVTGIGREKTIRALALRVRQAIDAPESERLLAGLDTPTLTRLADSRR